jgi:hypothetical protein
MWMFIIGFAAGAVFLGVSFVCVNWILSRWLFGPSIKKRKEGKTFRGKAGFFDLLP